MCGIATPYAAQVRVYRKALNYLHQQMPDKNFPAVKVGTSESWQGSELEFMLVGWVRGSNDNGEIGFLGDQRRANVLMTRQKVAWYLIADLECVIRPDYSSKTGMSEDEKAETRDNDNAAKDSPAGDADGSDPKWSSNNAVIEAVFEWFRKHQRIVDISAESLSQEFVTFAEEAKPEDVGWGNPVGKGDAGAMGLEWATG